MKLSVYIITYNEEKRLEATLKAACKVADEIVIVDSFSTDQTQEIASCYPISFYQRKWTTYAEQKNFAQEKCHNDWVLSLDADEVLSTSLIQEIQHLKKTNPQFWVYTFRIADMFPGMRLKKGTRTYKLIRLYHRKYATMKPNLMTEDRISLLKPIPVGHLKAPVLHFSFLNISHQVIKLNSYTDAVLDVVRKKHKSYSLLRLIFEFPRQFISYYILKRYFLHGTAGFIAAMNLSYARFLKIAKAIERNSRWTHL